MMKKFILNVIAHKTVLNIIAVSILVIVSGSVFAYHATYSQQQKLREQTGSSNIDTMPVSTASPGNITLGNTSKSSETTTSPTQPEQSSQSSAVSSQQTTPQTTPSKKTSCTNVTIPHGTKYQETGSLTQGQTRQWLPGSDGTKQVCVASNGTSTETVISQPVDAVVQVGTAPAAPTYTYDQAWNAAQSACASIYYDSSQHGDCVAKEMNKRGWYYENGQWVAH